MDEQFQELLKQFNNSNTQYFEQLSNVLQQEKKKLEQWEFKLIEREVELQQKLEDFEQTKDKLNSMYSLPDGIIKLNVGGKKIDTLKQTLTKKEGSLLYKMFSGLSPISKDEKGRVFVDRNPRIFGLVLEYLRDQLLTFESENEKESFVKELQFWEISPPSKFTSSSNSNHTKPINLETNPSISFPSPTHSVSTAVKAKFVPSGKENPPISPMNPTSNRSTRSLSVSSGLKRLLEDDKTQHSEKTKSKSTRSETPSKKFNPSSTVVLSKSPESSDLNSSVGEISIHNEISQTGPTTTNGKDVKICRACGQNPVEITNNNNSGNINESSNVKIRSVVAIPMCLECKQKQQLQLQNTSKSKRKVETKIFKS